MLISHKHKFVFVHNPKVGGTTFNDALTKYCESNAYRGRGLVANEVVDLCHYRVDQWPQEIVYAYLSGYYFFGIVRDPYEKFLSAMSEHVHQHKGLIFLDEPDGELRVEAYYGQVLSYNAIRHDWRYVHFCPQSEYFALAGDRIKCDILRLEQIDTWWDPLFERLGLPAPEKFNGRPSHFRPDALGSELTALVNRLYKTDFEMFGYPIINVRPTYFLSDEDYVEEICLGSTRPPSSAFQGHAARYASEYGTPPQPMAIQLLRKVLFP